MEKKRLTADKYLELQKERPNTLRQKLQDILLSVSWRDFSNHYMDKKGTWLYEKIDGFDRFGETTSPMTNEELTNFKSGLLDLSERIKKVAESL